MELLKHILTAAALAMDCTAIAIAYGLVRSGRSGSREIRLVLAFGLFQALLFVLGWFFGTEFRHALAAWDHWIAFGLLSGIGGKMLWESIRGEEEARSWDLTWFRICVLAVAASIDAMAVGLGFSLLGSGLALPTVLIGSFSVVIPLLGYHAATRFGDRLGSWAERSGGLILIAIGAHILIEHLLKGI